GHALGGLGAEVVLAGCDHAGGGAAAVTFEADALDVAVEVSVVLECGSRHGGTIPAQRMRASRRLAALVVALALLPAAARADDGGDPMLPLPAARYFYFQHDYGSEAMFGPLWVFMTRGYAVV